MTSDKPWEEEIVRGPGVVDPRGILPKKELKVGSAKSLFEMSSDFTFFTPAILYRFSAFDDRFLIDFVTRYGRCDFYWIKFELNLFKGLEFGFDQDWNKALWAIPATRWNDFVDFMCSVWMVDSWADRVDQIALQQFRITDPLSLSNCTQLQALSVYAFGLRGTKNCIFFNVRKDVDPVVAFTKPDEESIKVQQLLLRQNANPLIG